MRKKLILAGLGVFVFGLALTTVMTTVRAETLPTETQTKSITTNLGIYGGNNWDIAVDGDHVYTIASGVPNGFFYSIDAGVNWQRSSNMTDFGSGTAVEVDPTTHAVYVALDGLYKSTDYGVTLTKINDQAGFALVFGQGKLMTASNDTLYISADNGATFTTVVPATGESISDIAASATAGTFWLTTWTNSVGKLYKSIDSGATWTPVTVNDGSAVTTFNTVDANASIANLLTVGSDGYLWYSIDGGTTWAALTTVGNGGCGPTSMWTSTRWYACSSYSTNNGSTWAAMDVHTNVMRGPGKIVVANAANESVMYGDCMSGVCKSTDGGLTWNNSLDGITGVNVLKISQTTNKSTVWISSSNGLGRTTNFTSATPDWTWPILPCDPSPSARCDSSGIGESVWVKPDNADIVLAGSIGGWIYRSTNGTAATPTWTAQIPSVVNGAKFKTGSWNNLRPQHFITDPTNSNIVYLAMVDPVDHIGAVLKSTDAGATWTDLAITSDAPATILAMTKDGSALYAGTGEGKTGSYKGVYKYTGGTWTLLTGIDTRLNITGLMVDPETQTTVYASASNDLAPLQIDGFYKSIDSGATWTKIVPGGYHGFGAITVQKSTAPNTLYLSAVDNTNHGVLLKSSDTGTSWGVLYIGLKSESFTTVLFDGLMAGNKHGLFSLKSRAKLDQMKVTASSIVKGKRTAITGILKDSTTRKLLKNKSIGIYRLVGKTWKLTGIVKTSNKGVFTANLKPTKTTKYRLTWTPNRTDRIEYVGITTKSYTITVKKK